MLSIIRNVLAILLRAMLLGNLEKKKYQKLRRKVKTIKNKIKRLRKLEPMKTLSSRVDHLY